MGFLLDFFGAGPLRLKALLIGALAMALVCTALLAAVLWYRGEAIQARADVDLLKAQTAVLAEGLRACNAGVDQAKRAGDAAVAATHELLQAARRVKTPVLQTVERTERIIERPAPVRADGKPADCTDAWRAIEADRKSSRGPQ